MRRSRFIALLVGLAIVLTGVAQGQYPSPPNDIFLLIDQYTAAVNQLTQDVSRKDLLQTTAGAKFYLELMALNCQTGEFHNLMRRQSPNVLQGAFSAISSLLAQMDKDIRTAGISQKAQQDWRYVRTFTDRIDHQLMMASYSPGFYSLPGSPDYNQTMFGHR